MIDEFDKASFRKALQKLSGKRLLFFIGAVGFGEIQSSDSHFGRSLSRESL